MRAVGVERFGGPECLEVFELPDPTPTEGEVLVRVHAAAVNPTDLRVRDGSQRARQMLEPARAEQMLEPGPYVPGMDAAGVVEAVGGDVQTSLEVGMPVMAIVDPHGQHGAYAQKLAVSIRSVVAAPRGLTHVEAATLPMNGMTARMALDLLALEPGQVLAVTGAAGMLGGSVVQQAKAAGLRVIADASEADEALVTGLGADAVVRRGEQVAHLIRDVVPDGVDGLVDASVQNEALLPALRDEGVFINVKAWDAPLPRGIQRHRVGVRQYVEEWDKLDHLRELAEAGLITPRVAGTVPPERAADAHRLMEAGGVRGRWVIEF